MLWWWSGGERTVNTTYGPVVGRTYKSISDAVTSYYGVQYASATRWEPPASPVPWREVRPARHSVACPQCKPGDWNCLRFGYTTLERDHTEDCLRTDVHVPDGAVSAPIVVYVHGGYMSTGPESDWTLDTRNLAASLSAVTLKINYRLGALGFLRLENVTQNLGLRDAVAAVQWAHENAPRFGGNANRIVLVGFSAGAVLARAMLLHVPQTRNLVDGAALMSPGTWARFSDSCAQIPQESSAALVRDVGCASAPTVACLRSKSSRQIVVAQEGKQWFLFRDDPDAVLEGDVLPSNASEKRLMLTTTAHDAAFYSLPSSLARIGRSIDLARARDVVRDALGPNDLDELQRRYVGYGSGWLSRIVTDAQYYCPARRVTDTRTNSRHYEIDGGVGMFHFSDQYALFSHPISVSFGTAPTALRRAVRRFVHRETLPDGDVLGNVRTRDHHCDFWDLARARKTQALGYAVTQNTYRAFQTQCDAIKE